MLLAGLSNSYWIVFFFGLFLVFVIDYPKGVKQALWLTKAKLIEGLPEKVLSLVADPKNCLENQDERLLNVISHARLWHSTEDTPKREAYWYVSPKSVTFLVHGS